MRTAVAGAVRVLVAAAALAALTGCSDDEQAAPVPSPVPAPSLTAEQRSELLSVVRTLAPETPAGDDAVVDRALRVCTDLRGGRPADSVRRAAQVRFSAGGSVTFDEAQAAALVAVVADIACPEVAPPLPSPTG